MFRLDSNAFESPDPDLIFPGIRLQIKGIQIVEVLNFISIYSLVGHNERVQLPQVQDCPRHLRGEVPQVLAVPYFKGTAGNKS